MVLEPQVVALQTYDMKAQGWPTKGANAIAKNHASIHASPREGPNHRLFYLGENLLEKKRLETWV